MAPSTLINLTPRSIIKSSSTELLLYVNVNVNLNVLLQYSLTDKHNSFGNSDKLASEHQYSIRDLAEEFDVTTRTLRFYEEKGLLAPAREGLNRIYNAGDRTRLRLIMRGKRLGLNLQESSEIISMYHPGTDNRRQLKALLNKIREKRAQLIRQQDDLQAMVADLNAWEKNCQNALSPEP